MTLIERIERLAALWSEATGRSVATLSTQVVNDGKFFARLEQSGKCSTASWERFLDYFRAPANWPEELIPEAARQLLSELEPIATAPSAIEPFAESPIVPPEDPEPEIQSRAQRAADLFGDLGLGVAAAE